MSLLQGGHVEFRLVAVSAKRLVPVESVRVGLELVLVRLIVAGNVIFALEKQNTTEPISLLFEALLVIVKPGLVLVVPGKDVFNVEASLRAGLMSTTI